MNNDFQSFGVNAEILKSLSRMNIVKATPVQSRVIEPFLSGEDLLVEAPTGTGKTFAFGIPAVQRLDLGLNQAQVLVLNPTRELALQTSAVLRQLTRFMSGIRIAPIYGGESIQRQLAILRQRPHIVVATPGRLLDHISRRSIDLRHIRIVVLDEADRMLDMGFRHDLTQIMDLLPKQRQTALLSATISADIKNVAAKFQRHPLTVRIEQSTVSVDAIKQYFAQVQTGQKTVELFTLLRAKQYPLALVFVRTKHKAASLALTLVRQGFRAGALHGNLSQSQRDRVMSQYRQGELEVLVATDIAARGLDVQNIDVVINYDLPDDGDTYTHRIGRTGRAEQKGIALTFVDYAEVAKIRQILRNREVQFMPCLSQAAVI